MFNTKQQFIHLKCLLPILLIQMSRQWSSSHLHPKLEYEIL